MGERKRKREKGSRGGRGEAIYERMTNKDTYTEKGERKG